MNEEIHRITNKGKAAKNEWENDDSDFFQKKVRTTLFPHLLINIIKKRYISSVKDYKYLLNIA